MRFSVIKREPSYFFENIHEDLSRFLKDTFGDIEYLDKTNLPVFKAFRPAIEIKETKNQYKLKKYNLNNRLLIFARFYLILRV